MRNIGKTLEKLASREDQEDVISTYCKYFEQRMRILPSHVLPHFLHEVENCLFKYSVDQSLPLQNSTSQFANIECWAGHTRADIFLFSTDAIQIEINRIEYNLFFYILY